MANLKISELESINSGSININTDIIPMVDVDNASTKKVTIRDLKVVLNSLGNSLGKGNSYGNEDLHVFRINGYSNNNISLSGYSYGKINTSEITPIGEDLTPYFEPGTQVSFPVDQNVRNVGVLKPITILGSNFNNGVTYLTASLPEGASFPGSGDNEPTYKVHQEVVKLGGDNYDTNESLTTMVGYTNIVSSPTASANLVIGSLNNTKGAIYSALIGSATTGFNAISSLAVGVGATINGVGCAHIGKGFPSDITQGYWANTGYSVGGALGDYSLAVGEYTKAIGASSISLGRQSLASGSNSATIGYYNLASGSNSVALGQHIQTDGISQVGVGRYNIPGDENYGIFIVGNGTGIFHSRSNALRVSGSGDVLAEGTFINGGADYAEFFESVDGTTIPNGTVVELVGDKVQPCVNASDAIGVISTNPNILGNAEGEGSSWVNKYQKDVWGNKIYGNYEVTETEYIRDENGEVKEQDITRTIYGPLINPDYDPSLPYVPRENRPEWNKVGLLGQLKVLKNQPIPTYWKFMKDINDDIALYLVK